MLLLTCTPGSVPPNVLSGPDAVAFIQVQLSKGHSKSHFDFQGHYTVATCAIFTVNNKGDKGLFSLRFTLKQSGYLQEYNLLLCPNYMMVFIAALEKQSRAWIEGD